MTTISCNYKVTTWVTGSMCHLDYNMGNQRRCTWGFTGEGGGRVEECGQGEGWRRRRMEEEKEVVGGG